MPVTLRNFTKRIFVTVGTTEFDELVEKVTENRLLELFVRLGYSHLLVQYGRGNAACINSSIDPNIPLKVEHYRFKNSIKEDILEADLVISHAGSGTCLETLEAKRPLLVVVNETLQDNHQFELAKQLAAEGYLLYCTPASLYSTLRNESAKLDHLNPFTPGKPELFARWLDDYLGL